MCLIRMEIGLANKMLTGRRMIKTAVLTGPTGAIGIALIRRLLTEGISVYAVCRPDSFRCSGLPESNRLHIIFCDIKDLASLPELIEAQADAFFHLAWAATTGAGRNDMPAQIANIRGTIEAVHAAAAMGCHVFVGAGSQAEYGRVEGKLCPDTPCFPENGYGIAKLCAGQMSRLECQRLGIAHIWMRILSVYGPADGKSSMVMSTIQTLFARQTPNLTKGEQLWDYLYSGDAAEAIFRAALMGRDGAVYPLGSGQALPLRQYIEILRDTIDPTLPLGFGKQPYSDLQVMHLEADISSLRRDTGFCPQTDFQTGIKETVTWAKNQIKKGHPAERTDCD